MCVYIGDIFRGFETFKEGYALLAVEILPRLDWAKPKLSFKKIELFVTETIALGILPKAGGIMATKTERCTKIRDFPRPKRTKDVRAFLGAIGITKWWVKNFGEIKYPLTYLTGQVDFKWGSTEQVSFQLLREKCGEAVEIHGWDFLKPVRLYSDASLYAAGCVITQMREGPDGKLREVPIAYDGFTFTKSQRKYGTYKRELCGIVEFCRKYEHFLRSAEPGIVFTDRQPLTYFLRSSVLDGIYSRWASELRCLNVDIAWIPGSRNQVADALSRTIFPDPGSGTPPLEEFGDLITGEDSEPCWVWKDGKGGYAELPKRIGQPLRDNDIAKHATGGAEFSTVH